jgi:RNase P/RNase MRP subunit POP5
MLKLKPSQRSDRRYLKIKGKRKDVENAILEFIGVLGWAKAAPLFVSEVADFVILAIERKELINVKAALALSKDNLKVEKVSGTLKGLN